MVERLKLSFHLIAAENYIKVSDTGYKRCSRNEEKNVKQKKRLNTSPQNITIEFNTSKSRFKHKFKALFSTKSEQTKPLILEEILQGHLLPPFLLSCLRSQFVSLQLSMEGELTAI